MSEKRKPKPKEIHLADICFDEQRIKASMFLQKVYSGELDITVIIDSDKGPGILGSNFIAALYDTVDKTLEKCGEIDIIEVTSYKLGSNLKNGKTHIDLRAKVSFGKDVLEKLENFLTREE